MGVIIYADAKIVNPVIINEVFIYFDFGLMRVKVLNNKNNGNNW
jgi:hypothetical protein